MVPLVMRMAQIVAAVVMYLSMLNPTIRAEVREGGDLHFSKI